MRTDEQRLTAEVARDIVAQAGLAPSIHNTQPWRWRFHDGQLDLHADPTRQLTVADPDGRQLLLSCGAALLHARLATRAHGLIPHLTPMPGNPDQLDTSPDAPPLATLHITGTQPPDPHDTALAAAMTTRHTDRRPFQPHPLTPDVIHALRHAAEAEGAWLATLGSPDLRIDTAVLLARADFLETHDPAYLAELQAWSRTDPHAHDGIPRTAVLTDDTPRQSEFVIRDFDVAPEPAHLRLTHVEVERPTVVLLGTDNDRPLDRLTAGLALGRVLLTATLHGAATSPLGQALDIETTRDLLRHTAGGTGHAQMLIRVGYPDPDAPPLDPTPRRTVDDVLTTE